MTQKKLISLCIVMVDLLTFSRVTADIRSAQIVADFDAGESIFHYMTYAYIPIESYAIFILLLVIAYGVWRRGNKNGKGEE